MPILKNSLECEDINIDIKNVSQQKNDKDCGLYSLAFATALCYGDDPESLIFIFDPDRLRSHYNRCCSNKKAEKFQLVDNKRNLAIV
jgi:Ulp1 family protease